MRFKGLQAFCYCCIFPLLLSAQTPEVFDVLRPSTNNLRSNSANTITTFDLDLETLGKAYKTGLPEKLNWQLPIRDKTVTIPLQETQVWAPQFKVFNSNNQSVTADLGRHYQYIGPDTLITLSIFEDRLSAQLTLANGNYTLGAAVYNTKLYGLAPADDGPPPGACYTSDEIDATIARKMQELRLNNLVTRNQLPPVDIYFELDHLLYKEQDNSIAQSLAFLAGVFNGIQILYAREGINVRIHSIKVWDQQDNYLTNSGNAALRSFRDYIMDTQVNPNWDIAVLVSRYSNEDSSAPNGGLANIDGLCNSAKRQAYANISSTTATFPDYSWPVFLISHEIGHTLGAAHSHNCNWPEGPLDNCYCPEGDCPEGPSVETRGGTIMSYCYLVQPFSNSCPAFPSGTNPGVNFLLGFGEYPRAIMQQNILEAACLKNNALVDLPNLQSDTAALFYQANDSLVIEGFQVWNNGSASVDSFSLQLNQRQLGLTDTLAAPDFLLNMGKLAPGDTLKLDTTIGWPQNPGASAWTWILDPQQSIAEWHEGDNWVNQAIQQNLQFPQLEISSEFNLMDTTYYFKLEQLALHNIGGDIAAPIRITYYLSSDDELDAADFLIGTNNNRWLPQKSKISLPLTFFKPNLIVPEGDYYLISQIELVNAVIPRGYPNKWTLVLKEKIKMKPPRFGWFRN